MITRRTPISQTVHITKVILISLKRITKSLFMVPSNVTKTFLTTVNDLLKATKVAPLMLEIARLNATAFYSGILFLTTSDR